MGSPSLPTITSPSPQYWLEGFGIKTFEFVILVVANDCLAQTRGQSVFHKFDIGMRVTKNK